MLKRPSTTWRVAMKRAGAAMRPARFAFYHHVAVVFETARSAARAAVDEDQVEGAAAVTSRPWHQPQHVAPLIWIGSHRGPTHSHVRVRRRHFGSRGR